MTAPWSGTVRIHKDPGAATPGTVGLTSPTVGGSEGPVRALSAPAVDPLPPVFDGVPDLDEASLETLYRESHTDVYGDQVHLATPIQRPSRLADFAWGVVSGTGWVVLGILIGLLLARVVGGGV